MQVKYQARYPCSKNKSENIGYKFAIFVKSGIPSCVLYHWIRKNAGYFLMYCLSVYLIQFQSYRAFPNMAVEHWCLSLRIDTGGWSVNCSALDLFYEVSTKCSLTNYYILDIIE